MTDTTSLAAQHVRDLQAEADAGRLARLATCCRRRLRTAVGSFFRHGQLDARVACCPWPV